MATIALRAMEVAKTVSGNSPFTLAVPEAASNTYKKGAILTLNASGHVVEASADPIRILGVAASDAANDSVAANSSETVWIANDDTIFVANKVLAGAVTATSLADLGGNFGLVKVGNNWHLDASLAAHARRAICIGLDKRDAVGDLGGRLHFMFMSQFSITTSTS